MTKVRKSAKMVPGLETDETNGLKLEEEHFVKVEIRKVESTIAVKKIANSFRIFSLSLCFAKNQLVG